MSTIHKRLDELNLARHLFVKNCYASSMILYSWLDQCHTNPVYSTNIELAAKRFLSNCPISSISSLLNTLGIDHLYVLNIDRRVDRKLRIAFEFSRVDLSIDFFSAVDSTNSFETDRFYEDHLNNTHVSNRWDIHLSLNHRSSLKKSLSKGSVAYKLSQINIFNDALKKGYRKIAVFDDDVFFSRTCVKTLSNFICIANDDWKIIALGASDDLISRKLFVLDSLTALEKTGFYKPFPGKTCGSFAMLYDISVFSDLIEASGCPSGTFDNTALGAMYAKYPNDCYVLFPNIVTPSVADSDIRHSRDQLEHSKRMFWDLSGYKRWLSPIEAYVVCDDSGQSLDHDFEFLTEDVLALRFVSMSEVEHLQMPDDLIVHLSAEEFCQENRICDLMCEKLATTPSTSAVRRFFLYIK